MAVELELGRGAFLTPVLVRAVRAMGVQARLDLDRLADVSLAVEAVADHWGRGVSAEPLQVGVTVDDGRIEVAFAFPDPDEAARTRRDCLPHDGVVTLARLASEVTHSGDGAGSRLVLSFG